MDRFGYFTSPPVGGTPGRLVAFPLNLGQAFIHGEDGTAFWTFNLRLFCHICAPEGKNSEQRQC
jgi:hypothetical protein